MNICHSCSPPGSIFSHLLRHAAQLENHFCFNNAHNYIQFPQRRVGAPRIHWNTCFTSARRLGYMNTRMNFTRSLPDKLLLDLTRSGSETQIFSALYSQSPTIDPNGGS